MRVAELIDPISRWWDREFILRSFHREEVEAIMRVPLSCRYTLDTLFWLAEKSECGKVLWKLKVPTKIKVFGWRACCNILSTRINLTRKRIKEDNRCEACKTEPKTEVHALWNYGVAQDIWADCSIRLQKCCGGHDDVLQLMEDLITRLSTEELELFIVQAWFIWHQRNSLTQGKQVQALGVLNKRAKDYMEEFRRAQTRLSINSTI
ncbi:uncharacterized protein LOC142628932 [Castanea sativa]|uniref:uncharacterized protein LOC142628932 n=1 Tax=Castanea sativa TaxID=21020 RepID=UPI003F6507A4